MLCCPRSGARLSGCPWRNEPIAALDVRQAFRLNLWQTFWLNLWQNEPVAALDVRQTFRLNLWQNEPIAALDVWQTFRLNL